MTLFVYIIRNEFGDDFNTTLGLPLDSKQVDMNPDEIYNYFEQLEFELQRTHPYFIFNLDELGEQDFFLRTRATCTCM